MNDKPIDHEYTPELVCPHCGYEVGDSWEYFQSREDERDIECEKCKGKFVGSRHLDVTYTTEKAQP